MASKCYFLPLSSYWSVKIQTVNDLSYCGNCAAQGRVTHRKLPQIALLSAKYSHMGSCFTINGGEMLIG